MPCKPQSNEHIINHDHHLPPNHKLAQVQDHWHKRKIALTSMSLPSRDDFLSRLPNSSPKCSMCLEPADSPVRTPCNHTFCFECLTHWLQSSITCPICRHELCQASDSQEELHRSRSPSPRTERRIAEIVQEEQRRAHTRTEQMVAEIAQEEQQRAHKERARNLSPATRQAIAEIDQQHQQRRVNSEHTRTPSPATQQVITNHTQQDHQHGPNDNLRRNPSPTAHQTTARFNQQPQPHINNEPPTPPLTATDHLVTSGPIPAEIIPYLNALTPSDHHLPNLTEMTYVPHDHTLIYQAAAAIAWLRPATSSTLTEEDVCYSEWRRAFAALVETLVQLRGQILSGQQLFNSLRRALRRGFSYPLSPPSEYCCDVTIGPDGRRFRSDLRGVVGVVVRRAQEGFREGR